MSKQTISSKNIKLLWGKSGNRCAICKVILSQPKSDGSVKPIGEMAHIKGENEGSARYDKNMTDAERGEYKNLVLLCPTCHTIIDNDERKYIVDYLLQLKEEHEEWVDEQLKVKVLEFTFSELEVLLKYLVSPTNQYIKSSYVIIPPQEKIEKNSLNEVTDKINMGLLKVDLVKEYINRNPDVNYSERLNSGFVNKYKELKDKGINSIEMFYELWDFASGYQEDFAIRAAGLSALVYFFEKCEVFEK